MGGTVHGSDLDVGSTGGGGNLGVRGSIGGVANGAAALCCDTQIILSFGTREEKGSLGNHV